MLQKLLAYVFGVGGGDGLVEFLLSHPVDAHEFLLNGLRRRVATVTHVLSVFLVS